MHLYVDAIDGRAKRRIDGGYAFAPVHQLIDELEEVDTLSELISAAAGGRVHLNIWTFPMTHLRVRAGRTLRIGEPVDRRPSTHVQVRIAGVQLDPHSADGVELTFVNAAPIGRRPNQSSAVMNAQVRDSGFGKAVGVRRPINAPVGGLPNADIRACVEIRRMRRIRRALSGSACWRLGATTGEG